MMKTNRQKSNTVTFVSSLFTSCAVGVAMRYAMGAPQWAAFGVAFMSYLGVYIMLDFAELRRRDP